MRINLDDLFTATLLACGPSPEDEGSAAMHKYQFSLLAFWRTQLSSEWMNTYESRELLKAFFYWEQRERLMASQ